MWNSLSMTGWEVMERVASEPFVLQQVCRASPVDPKRLEELEKTV